MKWVKCIFITSYQGDIFFVVGDVVEIFYKFFLIMFFLRNRFKYVLYVFGNYDFWCRKDVESFVSISILFFFIFCLVLFIFFFLCVFYIVLYVNNKYVFLIVNGFCIYCLVNDY